MRLYPIALKLSGKRVVVVGAGVVAERKTSALLDTGAAISVIANEYTESFTQWSAANKIKLTRKSFEPDDIRDADIVIAATDSSAVNLQVYHSLQPRQWINIADRPDLCSFYVPAVTERGSLQIATFTGGKYPGLTKKLNHTINGIIGPEYEDYVEFLGEVRARVMGLQLDDQTKRQILRTLLGDQFLQYTTEGKYAERDQNVDELLSPYERGID